MCEYIVDRDYYALDLISPYYKHKLKYKEFVEREQFEYHFFIKSIIETLGSPPESSELKIVILPRDFELNSYESYKEIRYYFNILEESHLSYILQILSLYGNKNWKDNYLEMFEIEFFDFSKYKTRNHSEDMIMSDLNCSKTITKSKQTIALKFLMDYNSKQLHKKIKDYLDEPVYYYIIKSVALENNKFVQKGSGPNFEGGVITLCTCKHYMRTFSKIDQGIWIAGITSKNIGSKFENYIFYFARIKRTFNSQYELWKYFKKNDSNTIQVKSSVNNPLGDIYIPKNKSIHDEYNPNEYNNPIKGHSHQNTWSDDIKVRYKKPSKLLVFDPELSFVWNNPIVKLKPHKLTQGQRRKNTISEFLKMEVI